MTLRSLLSRTFPPLHGGALAAALVAVAVVCVVLVLVMLALPPRARALLIKLATFLAGLYYAAEFFWPAPPGGANPLTFALPTVGNVLNVLVAFTLGLGIVSLVRVHGGNVTRQRPGWGNSFVLLAAMVTMAVAGLAFPKSIFYSSLFQDLLANFDAAMFATLAFYIIGAAYRAFRIRSAEATLLMASALVVMLGQVPVGQYITHTLPERGSFASLFRLDNISNFLLTSVNAPAQRAIDFGLGIGLLAIGLRVWLSLERGAYFDTAETE